MIERMKQVKQRLASRRYSRRSKSNQSGVFSFKTPQWKLGVVLLLVALVFGGVRQVLGGRWDGRHRFNLVMATPSLSLFSYDNRAKTAVWVKIPDEMLIRAAYGYGDYRAKSIAGLDRQEKKQGSLVENSVAAYFGIMVDGYVWQTGSSDFQLNTKADILRFLNLSIWRKLSGRRATNLTVWDLVRLKLTLGSLREDKLAVIDLATTRAVSQERLADGSLAFSTDRQRLTSLAEDWFIDEWLALEGVTIKVLNTTGAVGLGAEAARMLSTGGVQVVAVESSDERETDTRLLVGKRKTKATETVRLMERWFGLKAEVSESLDMDRSDVVLYLGEDFDVRLNGG